MLTVCILARDEEQDLKQLLDSLAWVDRLLVVLDSGVEGDHLATMKQIAADFNAKVVERTLDGDWAAQRNFALKKARTKWVLFLDVDERVTDELRESIVEAVEDDEAVEGYALRRVNALGEKLLSHGAQAREPIVRLGQRTAGSWKRPVHEVWDIDEVEVLEGKLLHFSHKDAKELFARMRRYAHREAVYRFEQGDDWSLFEMIVNPVGKFLHSYIYRLGILDGVGGLLMALAQSYHSYLVRRYMYWMHMGSVPVRLASRLSVLFFWLVVWLMALGQVGRLQITTTVAINGFELVMGLSLVLWLGLYDKQYSFPPLPRLVGLLFLFSLALLGSLVVNVEILRERTLAASLYWWRLNVYILYGWQVWDMVRRGVLRIPLQRVLLYVGMVMAWLGWAQYLFVPDTRWLYWFGWDEHFFRMVGTLLDPGYLGLLFVLTLVILEKHHSEHRFLGYLTVFGALLLTYARSAYLAYGAAMVVLAWRKRSIRMLLARWGLLLLGVFGLAFLPDPGGESVNLARTYSIESRAKSSVYGLDLFLQRPWWGVGYNAYPTMTINENGPFLPSHANAPDNSLVFVLATSGLVGGIFLMAVIYGMYVAGRNDMYATASLTSILVHGFTNNTWFYPWVMLWLLLLLAERREIQVTGGNI